MLAVIADRPGNAAIPAEQRAPFLSVASLRAGADALVLGWPR